MTVEIAVANTRARIRAKDKHVYSDVDKFLSYFSKVAPYNRAYKLYRRDLEEIRRGKRHGAPRGWNGVTHLFRDTDSSFPAGLLDRVVSFLEDDHEVQVYDRRVRPEPHPKLLHGKSSSELRDWQIAAHQAARDHERGVFEAATGTGKTTLMASNLAYHAQPSLVLVNRATLAKQTLARFEQTIKFPTANDPFGMVGDGVWSPGLITVATYQTISSMLTADRKGMHEWLKNFKAIHIDEAHHTPARTFFDITNETDESYFRYGYSATPFKNDTETELKLVGACGEIIFSYNAKDAIADGILSPARIYVVIPNFPKLPKTDPEDYSYDGTFAKEYQAGIVNHTKRNRLLANLAEVCADHGLPTLVLTRQTAQGKRLLSFMEESEYITGKTSTAGREDAKKRLTEGDLPILIASTIFNEGEDIPAIGAMVNGGGYRAEHLAMQVLGRGLRPSPGKEFVLFFDVWDDVSKRLLKHSKSRVKAWTDAGFDVKVVTLDELAELMEQEGFFK